MSYPLDVARRFMSRFLSRALCVWVVFVAQVAAAGSFMNFESGHVRPLALSPDASQLFAVDTPDNRLEVYSVTAAGLTLAAEVQVGLEPVAVAARTNRASRTEVWVESPLGQHQHR